MRKGKRFLKRFKFAASGPWIAKVFRRCNCPDGIHEELMSKDENGRCSGTPNLKKSQAYPKALGEAIVAAWQSHKKEADTSTELSWTKPFVAAPARPSLKPPQVNQQPDWLKPFPKPASASSSEQKLPKPGPAADWTKPFANGSGAKKPVSKTVIKRPANKEINSKKGKDASWQKVRA